MSRELKFRIWDSEGDQMLYTEDVFASEWGLCHRSNIKTDTHVDDFILSDVHYESEGDEKIKSLKKRFIIQQFTNCKDAGGKDIYEGDIANINGKNYQIIWRGAGFYCEGSDYPLDACWFVGGNPHVVGNIFENPELIKNGNR